MSKSGSVIGGMLLVAGSCIGAGMLALPVLTGLSGFLPSLIALLLAWGLMTFTGLLLVEINGWFSKQVNLVSMAEEALGSPGKWVSWLSYILLFYSLLVAYSAASGQVFAAIFEQLFNMRVSPPIASTCFTLFFGYIVYLGTRPVDLINRYLMVGLIATYFGMIGFGLSRIDAELLLHFAPHYMFSSLSILVVSFGFQNMVPSLVAYTKGNLKRARAMIVGGSLLTLFVYLIWSLLVLGAVPFQRIFESYQKGEQATQALYDILGATTINVFSQGFAFFAIITSFIAQGLTLTHFLADGLHIPPTGRKGRLLSIFALGPPLLFALYKPEVFYKALSLAGGLFAMILFGILPVVMTWIGRYRNRQSSEYRVFGGRVSLSIALLLSLLVIASELKRICSS